MIHFKGIIRYKSTLVLLSVLFFTLAPLAVAHGPKGHSGTSFTALEAAKKGMDLYDRLVTSKKLEESWEVDLDNLKIFTKTFNNQELIVVKFSRSKGKPESVYIFFSQEGEYMGSNFTGN